MFEQFIKGLQFDVSDYLILNELSENQKKVIEDATSILKDNIVGDVKSYGGNLEKNEERFEKFVKQAQKEFEDEKYKDIQKDFKDYVKKLRELIDKTCVAIIPVKEMPWVDVIFQTVPRIVFDRKKVQLLDNAISYHGEIKCVISKTTIYGKMKDAKPLFAPLIGELDLSSYKIDDSQNGSKAENFAYVNAIINSLESTTSRSQLVKYHEGYQRHGEPICDFLMKNNELMKAMDNVTSGMESKRLSFDMAVCSIAIPNPNNNTTLILVTDENKDLNRFSKCFEAILRFSAACCEAPSSRKVEVSQFVGESDQAVRVDESAQKPLRTPGGQELKVWTQEELAEVAQQRGKGISPEINMWTEEDLAKLAKERTNGIPEGMEVWDERSLAELAKKRQGTGLEIPEWKPDPDLIECIKCGYSLRKGWSECPICGTPIQQSTSQQEEKSEEQLSEQNKKEQ